MAYIRTPQYLRELHGVVEVPIQPSPKYNGGMFGGPMIPQNRNPDGMFARHFDLPASSWQDSGPFDPLRSGRESGQPVAGLADVGDSMETAYHQARASFWKLVALGLGALFVYDKVIKKGK